MKELAAEKAKVDKLKKELEFYHNHYLTPFIEINNNLNAIIKDLRAQNEKLKAELALVKDTPGGKRIYGALNEIEKLKAQLQNK